MLRPPAGADLTNPSGVQPGAVPIRELEGDE